VSNLRLKTTVTILILFLAVVIHAQAPTPNFSASVTSGCSPLVVDFNDLSSGNPTSYFWDFGNGATSTLKNPSTTYFTEGVYSVKLTVKNNSGTNTLTRSSLITLYGKPTPQFIVSDSTGCFPIRSQFTDLSGSSTGTTNSKWFWDFGDGTQSTDQNPLHTYTSSGNFGVTIKVTNDKGCSNVLTKPAYIKTTNGVKSDFTNSMAGVCKPPFSISFSNKSTGPGTLSYLWDFGDGNTSTIPSPSHNYTTPGNYSVSLATSSTAGCSDTLMKKDLFAILDIHTDFSAPDSVCIKSEAGFLNTSAPVPVSSIWKFGDGTTSTDTMPVKRFTTVSTFNVTLYNTYSFCKDSFTKAIKVLPRPKTNFAAGSTFKCSPPFSVNFTDATPGAVSWQWDFGDSTTANEQNPSHTYNDTGYYSVKLITTNASGCTDTLQKDSLISIIKPIITIPNLPQNGCIPFTINPLANIITGDNVTSYLWDFGDGGSSTQKDPTYTYLSQGTYTVTLTITTSTGCTEVFSMPAAIKVGTRQPVDFSVLPNPVCALQPVQFTGISDSSDAWLWEFGDGTAATDKNPVHSYQDIGTFTVTFTAYNNGCPSIIKKTNAITVSPPIPAFSFSVDCSNKLMVNFKDESQGALSWLWDFGDGTTSTLQNPNHTYSIYQTYTVTLTVTNNTCSNSISDAVKLFDEKPDFNVTNPTVCRKSTVYFGAVVKDPSNYVRYVWNFGDGSTWDSDLFDHTGAAYHYYSVAGTYDITLTLTNIHGCNTVITKPKYVRINGPTANFSAINPNGCVSTTRNFTDLSKDDVIHPITSWKWEFGDGTSTTLSAPPFTHAYSDTGIYSVNLVVTDAAGCSDSISKVNFIHATDPKAAFSVDTVTCPGSKLTFTNTTPSSGFTSSWNFGDGSSSTLVSPVHAYSDSGYYSITLMIKDQFGCTDTVTKTNHIRVARPVASFNLSDSISSCVPFEVQFTNTSYFANSILWNLGSGTSTIPNPVSYYITPGTYQVSLAVTSPGGCTDTAFNSITLYDTIGSRITYLPLNGCKPLNVSLATYSPGPVTYTWDFGDGVILNNKIDSLDHIYNFFGDFVPKIIMTDPSGCQYPISGFDTIHIIGAITKFGLDKKLLCDSGLVTFIDSTTFNDPITSYQWSYGDGTTSSTPEPGTHYYATPGFYTVSVNVATLNNCVDTFTLKDVIKVVQSPLISIIGDSVICVADSMLQKGVFQRMDTSAVNWLWTFPNGNMSVLQNPALQTYSTAGTYTISTIATNSSGCTDTAYKNILVNPLPVITIPTPLTKQAGFPLTIPASYSSNVIRYNWIPTTTLNCTDCPQPVTNTKFNRLFTVSVVDSNGCRNKTSVQVIVVCPNANVFIPNTFSPNGDGSNDVLYVRGKGLERVKTLRIFNRWGEVVFEQNNFPVNDASYGWNGKYKGAIPHPDVYVYQVEVFCENSDIIRFEGNVALIQ
jgi:gliding motility-associated-like protein